MITLYILDVPEFQPVLEHARASAEASRSVGDYFEVTSSKAIVVDRREAGVRQAVWYSAIGALAGGKVAQFDRDALRIEPA
jgi:hypothetical protein